MPVLGFVSLQILGALVVTADAFLIEQKTIGFMGEHFHFNQLPVNVMGLARPFPDEPAQRKGEKGGQPLSGGALNDPAFLGLISDQALRRIIITGRPDLGMPPYNGKQDRPPDFHELSSTEIQDLVALLRSWRQSGGTP